MSVTKKLSYNELYDLTEKLYGSKLPMPVQQKNYLTRWNDLSDYWKKLDGEDPLYYVMHKIFWNCYPDNTPLQTHGGLYDLLEAEILDRDSSIHRARKPDEHFFSYILAFWKKGNADVRGGLRCHSKATKKFLYYRAYAKAEGKEPIYFVSSFRKVICKLIPSAKQWSDTQWLDDNNIFDAIQKDYGIDYRHYPEAFDQLYDLLDKKWNRGKGGTYDDIFGVEHLSWELAEKIWPKDTEKFILDKFCAAKKHIHKCETTPYHRKVIIERETLDKSWVIPYLEDLAENQTTEEKKKLFDAILEIWH